MNKTKTQMMLHDLTAMVSSAWGYSVKIDTTSNGYTFTIHDHGQIIGKVKTTGDCVNLDPSIEQWPDQALAWAISNRFAKPTDRARFDREDSKAERREDVKKLWQQGVSQETIAEQLFCSVSTVKRDLAILGLTNKRKT